MSTGGGVIVSNLAVAAKRSLVLNKYAGKARSASRRWSRCVATGAIALHCDVTRAVHNASVQEAGGGRHKVVVLGNVDVRHRELLRRRFSAAPRRLFFPLLSSFLLGLLAVSLHVCVATFHLRHAACRLFVTKQGRRCAKRRRNEARRRDAAAINLTDGCDFVSAFSEFSQEKLTWVQPHHCLRWDAVTEQLDLKDETQGALFVGRHRTAAFRRWASWRVTSKNFLLYNFNLKPLALQTVHVDPSINYYRH